MRGKAQNRYVPSTFVSSLNNSGEISRFSSIGKLLYGQDSE